MPPVPGINVLMHCTPMLLQPGRLTISDSLTFNICGAEEQQIGNNPVLISKYHLVYFPVVNQETKMFIVYILNAKGIF